MKRREFIYTTTWGGTIGLAAPNLFAGTSGMDQPILVVIQLAGGNDGLNTVIPIGNDHYYRARPKLAINAKDALSINTAAGLHPGLTGLKALYDEGQLAIVQGVGYPNPNRSHFRSTEIWHTASDAGQYKKYGWLGRYFDTCCSDEPASVGLCIGKQNPQAFSAAMPKGVTFNDPRQLKVKTTRDDSDMMMEMMGMEEADPDNEVSGASIGDLSGGGSAGCSNLSPLAFLENTASEARISSRQIEAVLKKTKPAVDFPTTRFARELQIVSQLIQGGMSSRIYYLSLGGFDTHTNQAGAHAALMKETGDALLAFNHAMKETGQNTRVSTMVFSEFGRRVKENASGGTDHGVAAPVFVLGGNLKGGLHGRPPSLAPADLLNGDLAHSVDYRSVYATLLEKHMTVNSKPILLKSFPLLDFIASA